MAAPKLKKIIEQLGVYIIKHSTDGSTKDKKIIEQSLMFILQIIQQMAAPTKIKSNSCNFRIDF